MKSSRQYTTLKSCKDFSYFDNLNEDSERVLVFFSGGYFDGSEINVIEKYLPKDLRILSPSYPGRGGTKPIRSFDSPINIAKILNEWLDSFDFKNKKVVLWGHSLGTAILNELMLLTNIHVEKIILLTPGEFLKNPLINKPLIEVTEYFNKNPKPRNLFKEIIQKVYPFNYSFFKKSDSKSMNEQLEGIAEYKINTKKTFPQNTLIINCSDDILVEPSSLEKIHTIYPNYQEETVKHEHIIEVIGDEVFVGDMVNKYVNPFLNS